MAAGLWVVRKACAELVRSLKAVKDHRPAAFLIRILAGGSS